MTREIQEEIKARRNAAKMSLIYLFFFKYFAKKIPLRANISFPRNPLGQVRSVSFEREDREGKRIKENRNDQEI